MLFCSRRICVLRQSVVQGEVIDNILEWGDEDQLDQVKRRGVRIFVWCTYHADGLVCEVGHVFRCSILYNLVKY